ncbi:hypothetical protein H2200_011849 [Cladophialophora chaetospira]|uniref:Fucose-specific lectin n=1 Tax=Cladophialophora chaetospira TaxID=386627 RepID=A0AA38WYV5_9EURO|nr:hypothetical protein H2200_011849 [Cladophialophora chaetospira]
MVAQQLVAKLTRLFDASLKIRPSTVHARSFDRGLSVYINNVPSVHIKINPNHPRSTTLNDKGLQKSHLQVAKAQSTMADGVTITSSAAVQFSDTSYLFYAKKESSHLAFLKGPAAEAVTTDENVPLYKSHLIIVDGNVVATGVKSTQVAAVAYILNGKKELRVYYIGSDNFLHELRNTDGGAWTVGSLDKSKIPADPNSPLSASVRDAGQLKLYYSRTDMKFMWCTWVVLGESSWTPREINDKW